MAGKTLRPQATQERTLTPMLTQCPECGHRMWWDYTTDRKVAILAGVVRQGKRIKNALQTEGKRLSLGFLSGESDDGQFRRAFLGVTRPRIERKKLHALMDILVLTCLVRWSAERKAGRGLRSLGPAQAGVAAVIHSPEKRCAFP